MNKAIIFDMDGTLFQTDKILEMSLEDTFNYLSSIQEWEGVAPLSKYREIMGVPLPVVWETLLPNKTDELRIEVDHYFLNSLISNINKGNGALYDNVISTLKALHKEGYPLFIASNGLVAYLEAIANYYQLRECVTEIYSIEQISTLNKSDLVKKIVEKHNITKGAVVGDRLSDINAAKDNGLVAIGCRFDFAKEEELAHADIVISHMDELIDIIKKATIGAVPQKLE